jgi:hypothetical protein
VNETHKYLRCLFCGLPVLRDGKVWTHSNGIMSCRTASGNMNIAGRVAIAVHEEFSPEDCHFEILHILGLVQ